jgi:hypothetical protein
MLSASMERSRDQRARSADEQAERVLEVIFGGVARVVTIPSARTPTRHTALGR